MAPLAMTLNLPTFPYRSRHAAPRPGRRLRLGIALGSGAARGWAHIGVLKALRQAGLEPDVIAGTSIGAVVGGCFAAEKLAPLEVFARGLTRRRILSYFDFGLSRSGLITGWKLCRAFDHHLKDVMIEGLRCRFAAVATEYGTGSEVWLRSGSLVAAMRASYALPGIFRPVQANGRWLMDGAFVNPIPVSACRTLGADIVLAVNLHADFADHGMRRVPDQALHCAPAGAAREPSIAQLCRDAFNITQERIAQGQLAADPPDVTITPQLEAISLIDFHRAEACIAAGHEAAQTAICFLQDRLRAGHGSGTASPDGPWRGSHRLVA